MFRMMLLCPAGTSFCMRSRKVVASWPTVSRPLRSRMMMPSCSRCWISRLMALKVRAIRRPLVPAPIFDCITTSGCVCYPFEAGQDDSVGMLNGHFDADLSFHVFDGHHLDGIPGAAIQKRAIRPFADALLAANAQERIDFDAAEGTVFLIRHPIHAIRHRAIRYARGRSRATRAALGNDRKFLGTLLPGCGNALRFGLHFHHVLSKHVEIMP